MSRSTSHKRGRVHEGGNAAGVESVTPEGNLICEACGKCRVALRCTVHPPQHPAHVGPRPPRCPSCGIETYAAKKMSRGKAEVS